MDMDWKSEASKTGNYEVYPEGSYVLKVRDWEKTEAKTGTIQIRMHFTILQPKEYANKAFTDHFALTESALWRLGNFVDMCMINLDSLNKMVVGSPAFQQVLNALRGQKVGASIIMDHFNGKERNKTEEYIAVEKQRKDVVTEEVPEFLKKAGAAEDEDVLM